ncbi:MAG: bacteriophage Gp15 family protein [Ruminococcus sp.]|nr:bacteriophage Gp15 family protein [Ruminococcus sp.]
MINPIYEEFPETVEADGNSYEIITDFRDWIRFSDMMNDRSLSSEEKIFLLKDWLYEPPEIITKPLIDAIFSFYRADELELKKFDSDNEEDENNQEIKRPPVFDWKIDSKCIIGDFQRFYSINLLDCKMHWWQFRCLFSALPDDSQVQKRISVRSCDLSKIKDRSERRRIMEIQRKIAIPFEYDDDTICAIFDC